MEADLKIHNGGGADLDALPQLEEASPCSSDCPEVTSATIAQQVAELRDERTGDFGQIAVAAEQNSEHVY